jgi:hypothetical protein
MKKVKIITGLTILFLIGLTAHSQDLIIKKNNDTLNCKVKEVAMDEIKYSLPDFPSDVLFSIDKDAVQKVVFVNGQELIIKTEMTNPENYVDNKKNAIKIDFLSPLTGNTTFGYERSIKPGRGLEATLGIIGLGTDPGDYDPRGAFVKFGMKFIKSPDFYLRGMRYAHILKGAYIKPEIQFGYYSRLNDVFYEDPYYGYYSYEWEREDNFTMAILLNIGKQWVFDNSFLVDWYAGVGYGFDSNNNDYFEYHYSFVNIDEDVPLSFTAGLKIGFLFK